MINVSGYTLEEKTSIAKKFLLPKQLKEHGMERKHLKLKRSVLEKSQNAIHVNLVSGTRKASC